MNRIIITIAVFVALGGQSFTGLLNWDIFKQVSYTSLTRYDSGWYEQIAQLGYTNVKSTAFFPFYPFLMRVSSMLSGLSFKACGQCISIVCFIVFLYLVQELAEQNGVLGFDSDRKKAGRWIASIIAFNPVSFYYTICYTESLFFMLTLMFMLAVSKRRWFIAGAAGFFAGITRNSGVFLALIFVFEYFRVILPACDSTGIGKCIVHYTKSFLRFIRNLRLSSLRLYSSFFNILLIPAGTTAYFLYLLFKFGSLTSAFTAVDQFGRSSLAPWLTVLRGFLHNILKIVFAADKFYFLYYSLELATVVFFIFSAFYLIRRVPMSYNLFMIVSLVLPLCKPAYQGWVDYFTSFPRYAITLFPYFAAIYGVFHRSGKAFILYLAASIFLLIECVSFWCVGKFIA